MNLEMKEYLSLREDIKAEESYNIEIQEHINDALKSTRNLLWKVQEAKEQKKSLSEQYISVLETAMKYAEQASLEITNNGDKKKGDYSGFFSSFMEKVHRIFKPNPKEGDKLRPLFASLPLVRIDEIKVQWNSFIEVHTLKVLFSLLASILTLILGEFTVLMYVLIFFSITHTLMRFFANKSKENDYVKASKNVQLFLWPYFLLAIGNTLSYIISIDGFPEGTFLAFFTGWIIVMELNGTINNAEIAGFYIPPALKKLLNKSENDNLPM